MPPYFWLLWLGGMVFTTVIGTIIVRNFRDTYGWGVLTSILTAYLITNTVMAGRLVNMGTLQLPFGMSQIVFITLTGTILWPFTSQIVDMINEVYGGRKAYVAAGLAYLGRIIFVTVAVAGAALAPVWGPDKEGFWQGYFGNVPRIVVAAAISYAVVQFLNIYVFVKFKKRTMPTEDTLWKKIKGGFLRSWGGDFVADLIDSPLFYFLAFFGTMPMEQFIALNIGAFSVKWIINQIDLPFYVLFRVLLEAPSLGPEVQKDY